MNGACNGIIFLGPAPCGPGEGQIRSNIIKFPLQSQFQRFFKPNFVCLLTNERYNTYQTGFLFGPRGGTWGYWGLGVKKLIFLKFNQIWCVSYSPEWHVKYHNDFGPHPLGPWGGAKRSNIIKQLQSHTKDF